MHGLNDLDKIQAKTVFCCIDSLLQQHINMDKLIAPEVIKHCDLDETLSSDWHVKLVEDKGINEFHLLHPLYSFEEYVVKSVHDYNLDMVNLILSVFRRNDENESTYVINCVVDMIEFSNLEKEGQDKLEIFLKRLRSAHCEAACLSNKVVGVAYVSSHYCVFEFIRSEDNCFAGDITIYQLYHSDLLSPGDEDNLLYAVANMCFMPDHDHPGSFQVTVIDVTTAQNKSGFPCSSSCVVGIEIVDPKKNKCVRSGAIAIEIIAHLLKHHNPICRELVECISLTCVNSPVSGVISNDDIVLWRLTILTQIWKIILDQVKGARAFMFHDDRQVSIISQIVELKRSDILCQLKRSMIVRRNMDNIGKLICFYKIVVSINKIHHNIFYLLFFRSKALCSHHWESLCPFSGGVIYV
jgi:hypothetical protein